MFLLASVAPLDRIGLAGRELECVGEMARLVAGEVEQTMRARFVEDQEHARSDAGDVVRHKRGLRASERERRRRVSDGHG